MPIDLDELDYPDLLHLKRLPDRLLQIEPEAVDAWVKRLRSGRTFPIMLPETKPITEIDCLVIAVQRQTKDMPAMVTLRPTGAPRRRYPRRIRCG